MSSRETPPGRLTGTFKAMLDQRVALLRENGIDLLDGKPVTLAELARHIGDMTLADFEILLRELRAKAYEAGMEEYRRREAEGKGGE
jgi:hypothetical protein